MELVDLKRPKEETKNIVSQGPEGNPDSEDGHYHYGLRVELGDHELKQIGMTKMPDVGGVVRFTAHARVHSVRSDHRHGDKKNRSVELMIEKLGLHGQSADDEQEGKLRGMKAAIDKALDREEGDD